MTAAVRGRVPRNAAGVALVLHGGAEHGEHAVEWRIGPVLRMLPFALALQTYGRGRIGVLRMKNSVYGWNADKASPLADTRWAIDEIRAHYPGMPIAIIGHSMGGRVALNLLPEPDVAAIAALAPWIERTDDYRARPGQRVLLMHGERDKITDPGRTRVLAEDLREDGADVTWKQIAGEGHAMLLRPWRWHRPTAAFVVRALLDARTKETHD